MTTFLVTPCYKFWHVKYYIYFRFNDGSFKEIIDNVGYDSYDVILSEKSFFEESQLWRSALHYYVLKFLFLFFVKKVVNWKGQIFW